MSKHYSLKQIIMFLLFGLAKVIGFFTVLQVVTALSGAPVIMVLVGVSMLPALNPYDVIILEPLGNEDVKIGDVVATKSNDPFISSNSIVHRVIKVWEKDDKSFVQTKGDNNKSPDHAMASEDIVGRMKYSVPLFGLLIGAPGNFIIMGSALFLAAYTKRRSSSKSHD